VFAVVTKTIPPAIKGYEMISTPFVLKSRLHFNFNGGANGLAELSPS
jgi:hypothetical protein